MLLGTIMLAVATGTTTNGWVIMYAISQLVFGFGVGGQPFRLSAWLPKPFSAALLLPLLHGAMRAVLELLCVHPVL